MKFKTVSSYSGDSPPRHSGFSLIEVMMAMTIFAFMATAVISGVLQIRKMAEDNLHETMALTVASGHLEQMIGTSYSRLLASERNPSLGIPMRMANGELSEIFTNREVVVEVPVYSNINSSTGEVVPAATMAMTLRAHLRDLRPEGQNAMEIGIVYTWTKNTTGETHEGNIRTIRANVR